MKFGAGVVPTQSLCFLLCWLVFQSQWLKNISFLKKTWHWWRQHSRVELEVIWTLTLIFGVNQNQSLDVPLSPSCARQQHLVQCLAPWLSSLCTWKQVKYVFLCAMLPHPLLLAFPLTGKLSGKSNMDPESYVSPFGWDVSSGQT